MVKIALGGIVHETNTFSSVPTTLEEFKREMFYGRKIIDHFKNTRTSIGGIVDKSEEFGDELSPAFFTSATPSGLLKRNIFNKLIKALLDKLLGIEDLDGMLLVQHGAMVVEGLDDPETYILGEVKSLIGERPIVMTTDFHANISREMVDIADCIVGYDTYPHVDAYERAVDAYNIIRKIITGKIIPNTAYISLPLLSVPQVTGTDGNTPMKKVMEEAHKYELEEDILNITVASGYPYSDIKRAGVSITVTFLDNKKLAKEAVVTLAEMIWKKRKLITEANCISPEDAVNKVIGSDKPLNVLVDVADNIGGGSPGDGTVLLKEIIKKKATKAVVTISDAWVVRECVKKGVGEKISLKIGAKTDRFHGNPIEVTGYIKLISDGKYISVGRNQKGLERNMGITVVLDTGDVKIIITEFPVMPNDPGMLISLGIDISDIRVLVVKAATAWKTSIELDPGDVKIIYVNTPGICSSDLKSFDFKNLSKPIYPFDDIRINIRNLIYFKQNI